MKRIAVACLALSSIGGAFAEPTIATYIGNIPQCAYSALDNALKTMNCDPSTVNAALFDCFCSQLGGVAVEVAKHVSTDCSPGTSTTGIEVV
jgi:hypothetical protein